MPSVEIFLGSNYKSGEGFRDALCLINLAHAKATCSGPLRKAYELKNGCDVIYSGSEQGAAVFADEINKRPGMAARIVDA